MEQSINELLNNIEKLHTTKMGIDRIKRNLNIDTNDVVAFCKQMISEPSAHIERKGKNWYVTVCKSIITVNAYSYTIITAHKEK